MGVLRSVSRVAFWLATRFAPVAIILFTVTPVRFFGDWIATIHIQLGMPPDPKLAEHAEQLTVIVVSAAVVAVDALWFFIARALEINYFRLKIELTLTPPEAYISRLTSPPPPVAVTLAVKFHPPRTRVGAILVNWALLKRSRIYISWKQSLPGSFRLGGDDRCFKCVWKSAPDTSHLRIPLTLPRLTANTPCGDQYIVQVAPEPAPQVAYRSTSFHVRVCRSFTPGDSTATAPTVTQYRRSRGLLLRGLIKLSVTSGIFRVHVTN